MLNHSDISKLESLAASSPFYVVDRQTFEANYKELTEAFTARYQPFILAYSYKTNYIPYLCKIIEQKGGWAEVVSRMEYDLAVKVGQNLSTIIFNGPVKSAEDIKLALDNGSTVNLDSEYELEHVLRYATEHTSQQVKIGLRINIGLSDDQGLSHVQNSLKVGRFGFAPADIKDIKDKLAQAENVKVVSLHGHTSTTDRSQWCFEVITRTLCEVAQKYFPESVEMINVGGGFFGKMHPDMPFKDPPAFNDYADVVCKCMNASEWVSEKKPTLVIEPGVAMVANVLSFITKVVSVKTINDRTFVTVDGSAFHAKPTFHSLNLPHQWIMQKQDTPAQTLDVVGSTCMEKDILLKGIEAPLPDVGDYLKIDSVGAYTVVMTPPFITPGPAILADENGHCKVVRRKQALEEIFSNYFFSE